MHQNSHLVRIRLAAVVAVVVAMAVVAAAVVNSTNQRAKNHDLHRC